MSARRSLTNIALAGALALGVSGCSDHSSYHYNGKIGEEQVRFLEADFGEFNVLEVTRIDGTFVRYLDTNNDLKLDRILIVKGGETTRYESDYIGQAVMEEGQSQFDKYLKEIHELKQTRGLNDIRKE